MILISLIDLSSPGLRAVVVMVTGLSSPAVTSAARQQLTNLSQGDEAAAAAANENSNIGSVEKYICKFFFYFFFNSS